LLLGNMSRGEYVN